MEQHKLAFIGPRNIHTAFAEIDDEWDFQIPLESLDDYEREISAEEYDSQISKETSVVIFFSRLYHSDPQKFAELVAFSAPYSVVCILIPESDVDELTEIQEQIRAAQVVEAQQNIDYNANTPFYFIRYEAPQEDIITSIENFVNDEVVNYETRSAVSRMLPSYSSEEIEEDDSWDMFTSDPNEISIPAAQHGAGQIIAVTSSKGGSGKSTIAISTASYIAKASEQAAQQGLRDRPLNVCVVDLDVRDGQLWFLTGAQKPKTALDIMTAGEVTPDTIAANIWKSPKLNCDFVFAAKRPRTAKEIPASFYVTLIDQLRNMYDVVVLDTSVNYLDPLLEEVAYPMADKILFVSDMGISSIFGCTRWIGETLYAPEKGDKNIDPDKVGIVINKALPDCNMSVEKIEKAIKGLPILTMVPSLPTLVLYATNTAELGQLIHLKQFQEPIKRIATAVIDTPLADLPLKR